MSKPASIYAIARMTEQERNTLHQMAAECDVTLSWAMREGARLILQDQLQRLRETSQESHATATS